MSRLTTAQRTKAFGAPCKPENLVTVLTPWGIKAAGYTPAYGGMHGCRVRQGRCCSANVPQPLQRLVVSEQGPTSIVTSRQVLGQGHQGRAERLLAVDRCQQWAWIRAGAPQPPQCWSAPYGVGAHQWANPSEDDDRPSLRKATVLQPRTSQSGNSAGEHSPVKRHERPPCQGNAVPSGTSLRRAEHKVQNEAQWQSEPILPRVRTDQGS